MILIGENIHIISKTIREALEKKDENFVKNLIKIQENMDCLDFNIGPAKGSFENIFEWLIPFAKNKPISFDSTNHLAIKRGIEQVENSQNCFINSTSKDEPRLEALTDLAADTNCNIIALALSKQTGIPKSADGRLELVFEIYEKCMEKEIASEKIFFDPLILPINVDQSQATEALNTIQMVKESFEPKVNTVIGLSNISNGAPQHLRPLINKVFGVMAFGAGLDAVIMDATDFELVKIFKMLESNSANTNIDKLYLNIAQMIKNFGDIDDIEFDKNNQEEQNIIKTAMILLNKKVYSDSFTQV